MMTRKRRKERVRMAMMMWIDEAKSLGVLTCVLASYFRFL